MDTLALLKQQLDGNRGHNLKAHPADSSEVKLVPGKCRRCRILREIERIESNEAPKPKSDMAKRYPV